jgi:addiction module HigA family antidote
MMAIVRDDNRAREEYGAPRDLPPVHPGEILLEEFLKPMGISQSQLALDLRIPFQRVNAIVQGKRSVTAATALLLGKYFGMSPEFWMGLQAKFDLERAEEDTKEQLARVRPFAKAS